MRSSPPTRTWIDLIRHGEPVGGRKYRGQIDDPLSEKGWQQMREAVAEHCPWQLIVSSPLTRCRAFAEELGMRHGIEVVLEERFKEIGFGEWEGRTADELMAGGELQLHHFWADPLNHRPPGAETLPAFEARVIAGWNQLLEDCREQHVLLVGHAGLMRMIIRHVLDMPLQHMFRIQVANAAITRIVVEHFDDMDLPRLVFHDGRL